MAELTVLFEGGSLPLWSAGACSRFGSGAACCPFLPDDGFDDTGGSLPPPRWRGRCEKNGCGAASECAAALTAKRAPEYNHKARWGIVQWQDSGLWSR